MPIANPAPLDVMRQITGARWAPGEGPSPTIGQWLQFVAATYPNMAGYCASVLHQDYFQWCGMTVAYCMARSGIVPVYGAHDVNRVQFSVGRDVELSPRQHGDRVNYLIFPYVELDGQSYPNVANAISFTDVASGQEATRASR